MTGELRYVQSTWQKLFESTMNTCWIEFLSPVTLVSGPISHAVAKIISDIADRLLDFCRRL